MGVKFIWGEVKELNGARKTASHRANALMRKKKVAVAVATTTDLVVFYVLQWVHWGWSGSKW